MKLTQILVAGVAFYSVVASADFKPLKCSQIKSQEHVRVQGNVTVTFTDVNARPPVIEVRGLPEGNVLTMNFQDIFGQGQAPDGSMIYATRDEGDGTIQDLCGSDKYNSLFAVKASNKMYCAVCIQAR